MKQKLTKRNIYITLFVVLYLAVGIVSLFHSFAFFGLANNTIMSVLLGVCFEIGQVAVLMSLLTSKKEQGRVMPWFLMILLTAVQIIGNIFSSYKYLALHSSEDLRFFKEPIFVWTSLPDNITTVIITYIVGGILPLIALCMTSMVSNYITEDDDTGVPNTALRAELTKDRDEDQCQDINITENIKQDEDIAHSSSNKIDAADTVDMATTVKPEKQNDDSIDAGFVNLV